MKKSFLLFPFIIFVVHLSYAQNYSGSIEFEDRVRNYEVYLPKDYKPNLPLVFAIHGYIQSISNMKNLSKMHEVADTSGFITVYPQSASISWNTGETQPPYGWGMYDSTVNDIGFFSILIDTLAAKYYIDLSRVYCCGFSSGGEMSYRLLTDLGHRFAAGASVSGLLNETIRSGEPIRPFPIIQMHGTDDPYQSYEDPYYNLLSVEQSLNFWIENNGCSLPADTTILDNDIYKISFNNCTDNNKVVHYRIGGGVHAWPLSPINASVEILNFFKNYNNPLIEYDSTLSEMAYGKLIEVYPRYIRPEGDSLFITAHLGNPKDHPLTVYAILNNTAQTYQDSMPLFDDGMHGDGYASDNLWGEIKSFSVLQEDMYTVELITNDLTIGSTYLLPLKAYFTTAGPVTLDSTSYRKGFLNNYSLRPFVHNWGKVKTITNASLRIICNDPWITAIGTGGAPLPDIAPNSSEGISTWITVAVIDSLFPGYFNFKAEVMVDGITYWVDSTQVITGVDKEFYEPLSFKLEQNFPNPFNPATTIEFTIPKKGKVRLTILNLLGEEIGVLLNEETEAGYHSVDFNASNLPSGVYFYQLKADNFIDTKKMLLLK